MTLPTADAEAILRARLGDPVKPPANYVVGFAALSGKVLAKHRTVSETRIWFQPPAPPSMSGVTVMTSSSNGDPNLNGPLLPLRAPSTMRAEIDSAQTFVDQCVMLYNAAELDAETAAEAKLISTELDGKVMDACVQLHGGAGYMEEYPISRMFTDARITRIFAGTSEIMKEIIGRSLGL